MSQKLNVNIKFDNIYTFNGDQQQFVWETIKKLILVAYFRALKAEKCQKEEASCFRDARIFLFELWNY